MKRIDTFTADIVAIAVLMVTVVGAVALL